MVKNHKLNSKLPSKYHPYSNECLCRVLDLWHRCNPSQQQSRHRCELVYNYQARISPKRSSRYKDNHLLRKAHLDHAAFLLLLSARRNVAIRSFLH